MRIIYLTVKSHDELELTVTDVMFANLTLSPPQTLTQLSVVADPPKHVTKAKERGNKIKTIICIPQCKHNGNELDGMVQCHLCPVCVHYECVGEQLYSIIGVWGCHACRQLPNVVMQLVDKVSNLEDTMLHLKEETQVNQPDEGAVQCKCYHQGQKTVQTEQ